ncbi:MAG: carbohydrate-binding protein [Chloroflexota bacterium]|nr:carbohydrate-binding protein [Chloroflexota bacterium]
MRHRLFTVAVTFFLLLAVALPVRDTPFLPHAFAAADPDLQPGFPVKTFRAPGSYHGGPAIHTLVENIDADASLEIVVTGLGGGPLYAWNADGTRVSGWPVNGGELGVGYPAMGELSKTIPGLEVFAGYYGPGWGRAQLIASAGSGATLSGWPRDSGGHVSSPASLADVDGDGVDEIFVGEEDWSLHGYKADGSTLPGWPIYSALGGQRRNTPAVGDLDGDGDFEIVSAKAGNEPGSTQPYVYIFAYHHDGTPVTKFPARLPIAGTGDEYVVLGDVDGDGAVEIVFVAYEGKVVIVSGSGSIERTMQAAGQLPRGAIPSLADLNGDGVPEIIVQTDGALSVWRGDGTVFPGWPVTWGGSQGMAGNSAPVIGDVDGDQKPDIVVTSQGIQPDGEVRVYNRSGTLHPRFPKVLPIYAGAMPAIADIDLDGRNEIVITGHYEGWDGYEPGDYDTVWVYDLGGTSHGAIEWGQFGGNSRHQGRYQAPQRWNTVVSLPGRVEAENYITGGEGVAYHDTTSGNTGGKYRSDDVDIQATSDTGGGYNVAWIATGEWLDYKVKVIKSGSYTFNVRAATPYDGKRFRIEVDGMNVTGSLTVPNTGGWQTWTSVASKPVTLSAGEHRLRLVAETDKFNLNAIDVKAAANAIALPGRFEVEDYLSGGQGKGYYDTTTGNSGGKYRGDDVDIQTTSDSTGGGYNVGWIASGEWLAYEVNVATSGSYVFTLRAATPYSGKSVHLEVDGVNVSGAIAVPKTGGNQTWTSVASKPISLTAGPHSLRIVADTSSFNLNYVTAAKQ